MKKLTVVEAHDAAVANMNAQAFDAHRSDCAVCQDFGRPIDTRKASSAGQTEEK